MCVGMYVFACVWGCVLCFVYGTMCCVLYFVIFLNYLTWTYFNFINN